MESGRDMRFWSTNFWLPISFQFICRSISTLQCQGNWKLATVQTDGHQRCCAILSSSMILIFCIPPHLPLTSLETFANLNTSLEEISPLSTLGHNAGGGSAELAVDTCPCWTPLLVAALTLQQHTACPGSAWQAAALDLSFNIRPWSTWLLLLTASDPTARAHCYQPGTPPIFPLPAYLQLMWDSCPNSTIFYCHLFLRD